MDRGERTAGDQDRSRKVITRSGPSRGQVARTKPRRVERSCELSVVGREEGVFQ